MPALITVGIFILFDLIIRRLFPSAPISNFTWYGVNIFFSLIFWFWIHMIFNLTNCMALRKIFAGIIAITASLIIGINLKIYQYFGNYINSDITNFLRHNRFYIIDCFRSFVWLKPQNLIPVAVLIVLFYLIWRPPLLSTFNNHRLYIFTIPLLLGLIMALSATSQSINNTTLDVATIKATIIRPFIKNKGLHQSAMRFRINPIAPKNDYNILLIINESLGKSNLSCYGYSIATTPWLSEWVNKEKNLYLFQKAFTNSTATDVSMPSIFTGVGPEEGSNKLHRLPLLWDWAKAAGYETAYLTSQKIAWANLDQFIITPSLDYLFSPENSRAPIINDTGIDDRITIKNFDNFLNNFKKNKFLAVINTNALHAPYQQTSDFVNPPQTSTHAMITLYSYWIKH
jgi:glucan phosphoethanolaminetransferase (alkaline phosphatase superfamily)